MRTHKFFTIMILIALLPFFLIGCGEEKKPATSEETLQKPLASKPIQPSNQATDQDKLKFKTADGTEALVVKNYSDHVKLEINYDGIKATIKGRANDKGRVKYKEAVADQEKNLVAKVKLKEDSIKLVDEQEVLLYKVKIKDGKVKISDNEEMLNSFELKRKDANKIEIRDRTGAEIGNVKFYPDNGKLKVKDAGEKEILIIKNYKSSFAPGVIMFKEIPVRMRCIIISELLQRGI